MSSGGSLQRQLYRLLSGEPEADTTSARKAPSEFCCNGPLTKVSPGLEVAGLGRVALPLDPQTAAALTSGPARLAPFGRGEDTVTDTSVRHTWQLEPSQFRLTNPREARTAARSPGLPPAAAA